MINWAIRYSPIVQWLRLCKPARVLDVGSGPEGLAMFWRGPVFGVELGYKRRPLHHATIASATALPFADRAFPVVVSSDLLEHVPPAQRRAAVSEMARVAGTLLLTFPSGAAATRAYQRMAVHYPRGSAWLADHLDYGLPAADQVAAWLTSLGWDIEMVWYESPGWHARLVLAEDRYGVRWGTWPLMRLLGPWLVPRLKPRPRGEGLRVFLRAARPPG